MPFNIGERVALTEPLTFGHDPLAAGTQGSVTQPDDDVDASWVRFDPLQKDVLVLNKSLRRV